MEKNGLSYYLLTTNNLLAIYAIEFSGGLMRTDDKNTWRYGSGSKDAARLSTLMANTGTTGDSSTRASIPMPPLEREGEDKWDVRGAMTLEGYQRLRKGYERGINPEALERMEGEGARQFPAAAPPYNVPLRPEEEPAPAPHAERYVQSTEEYEGDETHYAVQAQADYSHRRVVYGDDPVAPAVEDVRVERSGETAAPRSRRMGPIAVTLVLLIGIVGALLLYGGGMEYIADFFGAKNAVVDENLTLVTERPGAEPQVDPSGALAPGEEMEMSAQNEVSEAQAEGDADGAAAQAAMEAEKVREEERRELEEKNAAEKKQRELTAAAQEKAQRAKEEAKKSPEKTTAKPVVASTTTATKPTTAKPAATTKPTATKPQGTGTKAFAVQVRATPDKEEADRVARALRAKGGADVHVVASEKDGETMYRVRFGSFGSAEEGKAKAGEMGYANVWVIKR